MVKGKVVDGDVLAVVDGETDRSAVLVASPGSSTVPSLSVAIDAALLPPTTIYHKIVAFDYPRCTHVLELDAVRVFDPIPKIRRE